MMAIYLFTVVALWAALTWALWKLWRRWRITEGGNRRLRDTVALVICALWFGASFWYAGGQKYYYDAQVRRLCAQDGGIKVYEQVKLPAERFDRWGNIGVPNKRYAKPTDEYYFETEIEYLRRGDPSLERARTVLVRRSDGKVLGQSIRYARGGGDLPGPWHGTSFHCPAIAIPGTPNLEQSVFLKEEGQK
jgi:hypothetical protein